MVYREITYPEIWIRICCAVIVGGIIGLERGMKNRPAGLRTYMLVCVGSCLIMLTNQYIYQTLDSGDPTRLGAQVVSGIGFLGAGTIIVTKHNQIKGLTTAAGLWAAAGVGLALGIGFYEAAFAAAISIFLILTVLQFLEARVNRKTRVIEVYVELLESVPLGDFIRSVRTLDLEIEGVQFEDNTALEDGVRAFTTILKSKKRRDHILLIEDIRKIHGVVHIEVL